MDVDKVYQLLAHGRWFSLGIPASSTTKTDRHNIAEILLKVALSTKNQSINQSECTPLISSIYYFVGPCRATFPGCIFYKPFSCCNLDVILSVTLLPDILLVVNISEILLALL
jgi:hypothetical protein